MKRWMVILCLFFSGCVSVQISNYIKSDNPYERRVYGDYGKIVSTVQDVLKENGWPIEQQSNPAVYERFEDSLNPDKDVLFFTSIKQKPRFLYSTYVHLNIFVYTLDRGAQIKIYYQSVTPLFIKQNRNTRNDSLVNALLDKIEQRINE